jgi:hypothetical protein
MKAGIFKRILIGVLLSAPFLVAGCSIDTCYSACEVQVGHAWHLPPHPAHLDHGPYRPGRPHPGRLNWGRWHKVYVH